MDRVEINDCTAVHSYVTSDNPGVLAELKEHFSFLVPNRFYMKAFKEKRWDGRIRLHSNNNLLYRGLIDEVKKFCDTNGYECIDNTTNTDMVSRQEAEKFLETLNLPFKFREHQIVAFHECVNNNCATIVAAVNAGKSAVIYALTEWYRETKTLIIVPTLGLISQIESDFSEYGKTDRIQTIFSGKEKTVDCDVVVSTWQSIIKQPPEWFEQFDTVIVDEAHGVPAKSITTVLQRLVCAFNRFGFTGTLDDLEINKMTVEGLLGPCKDIITVSEMVEKGFSTPINLSFLIMEHKDPPKFDSYADEVEYIIKNDKRTELMAKLALNSKGNVLVIVQFVEEHGDKLYEMIAKTATVPTFYIKGAVKGTKREEIRNEISSLEESITVATAQTTATGVNIPSLDVILFASPIGKSRKRVIQALGRVMRKRKGKITATAIDVVDDLGKGSFSMIHYRKRKKMYDKEGLKYRRKHLKGIL